MKIISNNRHNNLNYLGAITYNYIIQNTHHALVARRPIKFLYKYKIYNDMKSKLSVERTFT